MSLRIHGINRGGHYYYHMLRRDLCVFCGKKNKSRGVNGGKKRVKKMTLDHIVPKQHGGRNHWMNFAPACDSCNNHKKGEKTLLETLLGIESRQSQLNSCAIVMPEDYEPMPSWWYKPLHHLLELGELHG